MARPRSLADEDTPEAVYPKTALANYILALLVLASLIAYIDRQVFALLAVDLKDAFGLSDTNLGVLQGLGLNLCFAAATLPLGLLVDRGRRVTLLWCAALGWSVFTALSGLCTGFWQLMVCRMGVGVAEAGLVPASYSLIADLFPPQKRQSALLIFMGAVYVSASLGVSLGGALMEWVGDHLRTIPGELSRAPAWRLTFALAAAPGLALAGLFLGAHEPARQERRAKGQANSGDVALIPFLMRNWLAFGGMCFVLTGVGLGVDAILMWLPTMLYRGYGLAPSRSGEWLGLALAFGSLIGVAGAAALTRILQPRRSETSPLIVLGFATTGAALILPGLAFVRGVDQVMSLCAAYFVFAFMGSSVGPSIMMAITPNHLRGRIVAIWGCVNLGAAVIWPPLIGWLSDHVFHGPTGLLLAFCAVALPVGFATPLILFFIAIQVRRAMGVEASARGSWPLSHESVGA